MARGSMMCGNFVSISVPMAIFLSSLACIIIGGTCLGVGSSMLCWNEFPCFRTSYSLITGSTFLTLAGLLMIIAIVMFSVIYCCPQASQYRQRPYIPLTQPVYVMGAQVGYPGPMALSGGAANQQVYALVPIQLQQQNGAQTYLGGYYEPANTPTATLPASGTPAATTTAPAYTPTPIHIK